ncbi:thioredoxin family protein [Candidatus Sumerlaeota bacterium]|nr:thioredoxin family protein [Candidatus Sumerlaeota bacterium]
MPRPPILEQINYKAVFDGGKTYDQWLQIAESREAADRMDAARRAQVVPPVVKAVLAALPRTVHVIAIAEDWCGDVQRHVPVLQALADQCRRLQVRYIARADHPNVFARFLSNGGEAIPKFIFFSDKFTEVGNWGALPEECRKIIARGKGAGDVGAARKRTSAIYEADPDCLTVVAELMQLVETAVCDRP